MKISYVSMATRVIINQSKNFEVIRSTQNPVIILAHKFAHDLEFVTWEADKINQFNQIKTTSL